MKILIIFLSIFSLVFADGDKGIFVVNNGWHSGIIVKVEDINRSVLDLEESFKGFEYIEIGWGDEEFYKSKDPSIWMTLKAAIIPTSSVMHVRAYNSYMLNYFSEEHIVQIRLSHKAFEKLLNFIVNSFAREEAKVIILSKGLYENSLFYLSSKNYHLFNTCNVWTANALRSADVDVSPYSSITTNSLFSQLKDKE